MIPPRPQKPDELASPARPPKPSSAEAKPAPPLPSSVLRIQTPLQQRPESQEDGLEQIPVLANLSDEEITRLLADPALLEAVYLTHAPQAQQRRATLAAQAEQHRQLQHQVRTLQQSAEKRYHEACEAVRQAREQEQTWEEAERAMYAALQPTTADALFAQLQAATVDAERLSEALLASFLEGQQEAGEMGQQEAVAAFIKEYRHLRGLFHLRSEKLARWKEGRVGGFR